VYMKIKQTAMIGLVVAAVTMTGCSTFGNKGADEVKVEKTEAISRQEFTTFFENDGIKVDWECIDRNAWTLGITCKEKSIKSIEVTVTIPTNGGTNFNASNAVIVGQEEAKGMLARFILEEVSTERVTTIKASSRENQDDTYRNPISGTDQVATQANDPEDPNMNYAVRSNANNTVRELHTVIRSNSQLILRGLRYENKKRDDQLLQVRAIWNRDTSELIKGNLISNFQ
jgi:hypothetical protein